MFCFLSVKKSYSGIEYIVLPYGCSLRMLINSYFLYPYTQRYFIAWQMTNVQRGYPLLIVVATLSYHSYPYMAVVLNFSQMWALYCLVTFYNVTHERLQSINPLAKFISFKVIVFATWWQGVGIALLSAFGVLPKEVKVQAGLQNFLICIEVSYFHCCGFLNSILFLEIIVLFRYHLL